MLYPIELSMHAVINKLSLVWVSPCRVTILDDKNCPLLHGPFGGEEKTDI